MRDHRLPLSWLAMIAGLFALLSMQSCPGNAVAQLLDVDVAQVEKVVSNAGEADDLSDQPAHCESCESSLTLQRVAVAAQTLESLLKPAASSMDVILQPAGTLPLAHRGLPYPEWNAGPTSPPPQRSPIDHL
jgi:hypothetical protein